MAHVMREHREVLPRVAASAVAAGQPVRTSASAAMQVVPLPSANQRVLGIAVATAATYNTGVAVQTEGVAKCVAGASVGVGALLAQGSSNGALVPAITASAHFIVGESQGAAAAGEYFSVLLKPGTGLS
jgi:hypothetical protein